MGAPYRPGPPLGPVSITPPPRVKPSGWWYAATLGIGLLGFVIAGVLLAGGWRDARGTAREITRIEPGVPSPVTFDHEASYTLYYLGGRRIYGSSEIPALRDELRLRMVPEQGGPEITFEPYEGMASVTQTRSGLQQVALATFHVDRPGNYTLYSTLGRGVGENESQLVVSGSPFRPLKRNATQALVALGVCALLSGIATIALAVTRGRALRALRVVPATLVGASRVPVGPAGWHGPPPIVPPPPPGYGPPDGRR